MSVGGSSGSYSEGWLESIEQNTIYIETRESILVPSRLSVLARLLHGKGSGSSSLWVAGSL